VREVPVQSVSRALVGVPGRRSAGTTRDNTSIAARAARRVVPGTAVPGLALREPVPANRCQAPRSRPGARGRCLAPVPDTAVAAGAGCQAPVGGWCQAPAAAVHRPGKAVDFSTVLVGGSVNIGSQNRSYVNSGRGRRRGFRAAPVDCCGQAAGADDGQLRVRRCALGRRALGPVRRRLHRVAMFAASGTRRSRGQSRARAAGADRRLGLRGHGSAGCLRGCLAPALFGRRGVQRGARRACALGVGRAGLRG
jgi:hypothetical protein